MNEHARALGKMGKGKPKTISPADRERRRKQMLKIRRPARRKESAATRK